MTSYSDVFAAVVADPRYRKNIEWGEPRSGHPEGTIRAHIQELEANLGRLKPKLSDEEFWKVTDTRPTLGDEAEVPLSETIRLSWGVSSNLVGR